MYLSGSESACCPECQQTGEGCGRIPVYMAGVIDPVGWGTVSQRNLSGLLDDGGGLGDGAGYLGLTLPDLSDYATPDDAAEALAAPPVGDPSGFFGSGGNFNNFVNPGIQQFPAAVGALAAGIPVVGPFVAMALSLHGSLRNAKQTLNNLLAQFGIGLGRREADIITPVQNQVASRFGVIDYKIGHDAMGTSDLALLYIVDKELHDIRTHWFNFLNDHRTFTDGRASAQAANTIMPLLDGTGGYTWPSMSGYPVTTDEWGNPTNGGRIGAVERRIVQLGGTPGGAWGGPILTVGGIGISLPMLIAGGALLYAFTRRRGSKNGG